MKKLKIAKKKISREDNVHKYFSEKELETTAKEVAYIKTHLEEYKKNNNWNDLKSNILDK